MKFKLFALAALMAAGSANAAIDNGAGGNGDLFFSIWDTTQSYSRDLGFSIDAFQTTLAGSGAIDLSWAGDATFTSFLAGVADVNALHWNIVATDTSGARRNLVTYTLPEDTTPVDALTARSMAVAVQGKINSINLGLGSNDSAVFLASDAGYTGNDANFGTMLSNKLGFDSTGTLANDSYASGLGFMRVDSASIGSAASGLNEYIDETVAVNAWLDGSTLHLSAVAAAPIPEADTYAFMALGMGLVGLLARRRKSV
jgi:hypothetical protein